MPFFGVLIHGGEFRTVTNRAKPTYGQRLRQSFSAFCTTRVDDFATVFGAHSLAEAVSAFVRGYVWLISSFHKLSFFWFIWFETSRDFNQNLLKKHLDVKKTRN